MNLVIRIGIVRKERCVFHVPSFKPSKSLRNVRNQGIYKCTFDLGFEVVVDGCSSGDREDATWILPEVMEAYTELHKLGFCSLSGGLEKE